MCDHTTPQVHKTCFPSLKLKKDSTTVKCWHNFYCPKGKDKKTHPPQKSNQFFQDWHTDGKAQQTERLQCAEEIYGNHR